MILKTLKRFRNIVIPVIALLSYDSLAQEKTLRIINTTDFNGSVFGWNEKTFTEEQGGLASLATYLENLKDSKREQTLLLDNGDILQGHYGMVFFNSFPNNKSHIFSRAMNYLGFDAASIGNRDLGTGHEVYDRVRSEMKFPWLAANIIDSKTGKPYFQPYAVFKKNGIKVAVLGLSSPGFESWLSPELWSGMYAEDMVTSAQKWVKIIREKEKPDLIIGLFHSGYSSQEQSAKEDNEIMFFDDTERVARLVPGFDLILYGHDHRPLEKVITNVDGKQVYMYNPGGQYGSTIGEINITYNLLTRSKKIDINTIRLSNFKRSEKFLQVFKDDFQDLTNYIKTPIYYQPYTLKFQDAIFGPSRYMNIVNSVKLAMSGADISLASPYMDEGGLDSGDFYYSDLYNMYRYDNKLIIIDLYGYEIKKLLEYSAQLWFKTMTNPDEDIINMSTDQRGRKSLTYNFFHYVVAGGIRYQIDVTRPIGNRVRILSMDDDQRTPFDMNKKYKVVTNTYRIQGGGGYAEHIGLSADSARVRTIYKSEEQTRDLALKFLQTHKDFKIKDIDNHNWEIVPKAWTEPALARDREALYPSKTVKIKLIGMADLHGNFLNYDHIRQRPSIGGYPYVYTYVENERKNTDQEIVMLNCGDILQGQFPVYYYNYVDTREDYMPSLMMNKLGLDVSVMGNHDIEVGRSVYERFVRENKSEMVTANLVYKNTERSYFKPYTCLFRDGIKIAILGLTTPIQTRCVTAEAPGEFEVIDMIGPAEYWVEHISREEQPDLIIGLFHVGFKPTVEESSEYWDCSKANAAKYIAEKVPGFDAVFLGHLHSLELERLPTETGDSVWLIEAGHGGTHLGVVEFEMKKVRQGSQIVSSSAQIVRIDTLEISETIKPLINQEMELLDKVANEKIATLVDTISATNAFFGPNFFVDMIHKVQLDYTGADVSFASPLAMNVFIPPGEIRYSDMFRIYRYENTMTMTRMTGQEIKDYLEYSADLWIRQMSSPNDTMLRLIWKPSKQDLDFEYPQYYFDSGAGLDYEVDLTKPMGERIRILRMSKGQAYDPKKMYNVVNNTYRAYGAGGHLELGAKIPKDVLKSRRYATYEKQIRELIKESFIREEIVTPFSLRYWQFVPTEYLKTAQEREKPIID